MKPPLTWEDLNGIVHAVIEDNDGYPPPRALVVACLIDATWLNGRPGTFGHIASGEIRMAARRDPLTCLACIAHCGRR